MVVSRWRESLNGIFWCHFWYYLRKNQDFYGILFLWSPLYSPTFKGKGIFDEEGKTYEFVSGIRWNSHNSFLVTHLKFVSVPTKERSPPEIVWTVFSKIYLLYQFKYWETPTWQERGGNLGFSWIPELSPHVLLSGLERKNGILYRKESTLKHYCNWEFSQFRQHFSWMLARSIPTWSQCNQRLVRFLSTRKSSASFTWIT